MRMTAIRLSCFALVISAIAAACAPVALADDAEWIYDPSTVVFIDLTLSKTAEEELEDEPEEYVAGTFSLTKSSDGTPAGEELTPAIASRPAEIRLKGSVGGSFREITEKAGFKLKFKAANAVLGLRKMTLNNMVQDPSMLHETLAYAAFRAAGVPASRTGFAYVRLNGDDIGVYLNLENLDNIGLSRIFNSPFEKNTQHIYEGEYGDDVVPDGAEDFEVDEGNDGPGEIGDLETLIEAVNGAGAEPWSERVSPYADLTEMTSMWAVEKYIEHWDGYSGHAVPTFRPNNYYLYSDPTGRFQMLPWGTDQAWVQTEGVPGREVTFDGEGGVLFNMCLEDEACFRAYWEALDAVTETIPGLDPDDLAEDTADLLAPWQAEERANGRPEFDEGEVEDGVEESLGVIAGRQLEAEEWLEANVPPEPKVPAGNGATTSSPGTPSPSIEPEPRLAISRAVGRGGVVTLRLYLPGPGRVLSVGTIKNGKGRLRACVARDSVGGAGRIKLRCQLSEQVLKRLHHHPVKLTIRTRFVPKSGEAKTITDRAILQRIRSH